MPSLAQAAETLTTLARSRVHADRERLLTALGALCESSEANRRPEIQTRLTDLVATVLNAATGEARARLVKQLITASWTPSEVAARLAREPLSAAAVAALLARGEPAVDLGLASNDLAEIAPEALNTLAERAREQPGLRPLLVQHPRLKAEAAETLQPFLGKDGRERLSRRFPASAPAEAHGIATTLEAGGEQALVTKLHATGRLGPGSLLRFLRDRRLVAFQCATAGLAAGKLDEVQAACDALGAGDLQRLTERAGVDRSVWPTLLALVRPLNGGRPGDGQPPTDAAS